MPVPIKSGRNFEIYHSQPGKAHAMKAPEMCRDFYEIGYIISGDRACITDNMIAIIHGGDVGVTNRNVLYRSSSMSDAPYERILLKFTPLMAKPLIKAIGQKDFDIFVSCPVYHFSKNDQTTIHKIFVEMLTEFELDEPCSELILQGLLHKLIITIIRTKMTQVQEDIKFIHTSQPVIDAIYFIGTNYYEDPSLETTAKKVNLSPFYFSKIFKEATGCTYSKYLNHVKFQHVRILLAKTDLSIDEITEKCGFSNRSYMCAIFKKIDGRTPKKYRNDNAHS